MSELLNVLHTHQEELLGALGEQLSQDCPVLVRTDHGAPSVLLDALLACFDDDDKAGRKWARALSQESSSHELGYTEVLAGLGCLERVVHRHVVEALAEKTDLLAALAELGGGVDRLRRCYVDTQLAAKHGEDRQTQEFVGFAESAGVFICLATGHGKPFYLNQVGRRLIGLDDDEPLPSTGLHHYYSEASWKELRDVAVPAVNKSGHWEGRSSLRNIKSGELLDVQTTMFRVRPARGDKPSRLAIVHRDAGHLKRLEQSLAESQARKHAILESCLDPIVTIDHEGVITEFNRAAEKVFGHSRERVLGTRPSEVLFPPSMSADHRKRIERYLAAGEGSLLGKRIEVTAVRAGGETFPAEMAMTINQEHGVPVLTLFVRDISQRKRAEREQARYAAELQRSNRELEQFAYVTSHDLQEPLRKIRTFSDRLEMQLGENLDATVSECVRRMQSAAGRMQALIEELLTLSRIITREQNFVPVDLTQVAREVVSDLEAQIEQVDGRVEVGKLPTIEADALQMRQLMQNLIANGLKFRRIEEPPLVKLHGRFVKGRKQRQPGLSAADEQCRIIVEDNGIGFDEKHAERIFGVFQRLHPRDVYEGTGVGLAICRRIVERHEGTITARSNPGSGSTFEVLLPVARSGKKK